jgi:hypothetical protein
MPRFVFVAIFAPIIIALAVLPSFAEDRPSPADTLLEEPSIIAQEPKPTRPPRDLGGAGPGGGAGGPPGYEVTWMPTRPVRDRSTELGYVRQSFNFGMPVWRGDNGNMVMTRVSVANTLFQTDAILPDTGRRFPQQLWNVNLSTNYLHRFDNGWTGMLLAGFGSASDKPFDSIDEVTATLGGFVTIPAAGGRDRWQLGAIYLYGGPVNFPLPVVSYTWNPTDRLRVNIGLPMSVNWRPNDEWELNLSYTPLLNINSRLTYTPRPGVQIYAGYEFVNESYLLADRVNQRDRFFGFEQRVVSGIRCQVRELLTIEANGGYAFGRSYGEGDNQWGTLRDRVNVRPGPFLSLRIGMRF